MNKIIKHGVYALLLSGIASDIFGKSDYIIKPLRFGAFTSLGMYHGDTITAEGNSGSLDKQPFTRLGAWMKLSGTIRERVDVSVLLSALRWNSLPITQGSAFTRNQLLAPGLGHAFFTCKFGDVENPFLKIRFGDMAFKYAPSKNLGGHLYKSQAYPGFLDGNFWNLIDGSNYNAQGLHATVILLEKRIEVDFTAFIEHDIGSHFDISPGLLFSYSIGNKLKLGGGAVFAHLISFDEDKTTPKRRNNAYYKGAPLSSDEIKKPGLELSDPLVRQDPADTLIGKFLDVSHPRYAELSRGGFVPKYYSKAENGIPNSELSYYTFRGIKAMGRFHLTPFEPVDNNPEPIGIYGEVTLLGIKNYPFYYEKLPERMPALIGINLPFPGISVNFEVEHYMNKFKNDFFNAYEDVIPIWTESPETFIQEVPGAAGGTDTIPTDSHNHGTIFWSLRIQKSFYEKLTLSLKIARDYTRPVNFFQNPSYMPAFRSQKSWYLVLKSEVNI